jgi:O-antigen ligase
MASDAPTHAPAGSKAALVVLVTLVVLSPWPFGSAHLRTTQAIAIVSLATALGAFLWDGRRGQVQLPPRVFLWPLLGLWTLAVFQLLPLPEALHLWIAPGSAAVWHPDVPAAAAVLGLGPHPISLYPEATGRWIAFATGVVALALAAAPALRDRRLLLRASISVVTGGLLVAVYGLVARLAFGDKLFGFLTVPTIAPFGPFVSKNHFAGYVEMTACLAVGLAVGLADEARSGTARLSWLDSRRARWVVVAWGTAGVLVLAVGVSLSRGGVVSLVAGLVLFVAIRFWTRRHAPGSPRLLAAGAASLLVAAIAVATVLPSDARSRVSTLFSIGTRGPDPFRLGVWRDSLRLAAASPIVGSGLGAFADALPRFKTAAGDHRVEHAENDYLEVLAEGGGVAGTLAGIAAVSLLGLGLRRLRAETHRLARGLGAGALAGVIALLAHSAYDFNARIPSNALLFCLLAAIVIAPVLPTAAQGMEPTLPHQQRARSAVLVLLVLMAAAGFAFSNPWAHRRLDSSQFSRATGAPAAALRRQALEETVAAHLRRRPSDAPAWLMLGWLRLPTSHEDASTLASWGVRLDPEYVGLRRAAYPFVRTQHQHQQRER